MTGPPRDGQRDAARRARVAGELRVEIGKRQHACRPTRTRDESAATGTRPASSAPAAALRARSVPANPAPSGRARQGERERGRGQRGRELREVDVARVDVGGRERAPAANGVIPALTVSVALRSVPLASTPMRSSVPATASCALPPRPLRRRLRSRARRTASNGAIGRHLRVARERAVIA